MMPDEIKQITLAGVALGYRMYGAGPEKQPLVFVHGYGMRSTAAPYAELLALLAPHYAVYALDLRGHGASAGAVDGWTFDALADDVASFSQALALDKPVFVGHSFGSVIGLLVEIRHPGLFSALCLLSPGPADATHDSVDALELFLQHGNDRDLLREGVRQMFVHPTPELLEPVLDAMLLVDNKVHRAMQQQNAHVSIDDRLPHVAAPLLLLGGERDSVVAPARQHDMARKVQRAKEVTFLAEGHMLVNEHPSVAAREILAFLGHDQALLASKA